MNAKTKLIGFLVCFLSSYTNAIIIRHDVEDKNYIELAKKYADSVVWADGCMGTVLNEEWILTAAHCVLPSEHRPFWVEQEDEKIPVYKRFINPKYQQGVPGYDIALLQLKWPLKSFIQTRLYHLNNEANKEVLFVGRGDFGNGLKGVMRPSTKLRAAQNIILSVTDNELLFEFNEPSTALPFEGISGPHDSGGPAFIRKNDALYIAGVSSWQAHDKKEGLYGVTEHYSRVSTEIPWIEHTLHTNKRPKNVNSSSITILKKPPSGTIDFTDKEIQAIKGSKAHTKQLLLELAFKAKLKTAKSVFSQIPSLVNEKLEDVRFVQYLIEIGNWELLELVLLSGANVKGKNSFGESFLSHLIVSDLDEKKVQDLVPLFIAKGAEINVRDPNGNTALAFAVYFSKFSQSLIKVNTLLANKADPNIVSSQGYSVLMEAARNCHYGLIGVLLKHGADKSLKNSEGKSAYDFFNENCEGSNPLT